MRILPNQWGDVGGSVPVEEGVRKFRAVMNDPHNYPVLVHCFAGIHRTGAYCAIYRMEFEHWSNAQAIAEMKACGYTNLDDELDILGYLEQYRPSWMPKEETPSSPPSSAELKEKPKSRRATHHKPAPNEPEAPSQLTRRSWLFRDYRACQADSRPTVPRVEGDHRLDGAVPQVSTGVRALPRTGRGSNRRRFRSQLAQTSLRSDHTPIRNPAR